MPTSAFVGLPIGYLESARFAVGPGLTRCGKRIRIIAAEEDYRCPIAQSEEYYTWLKKLGKVPVDFVRLPKASHSVFASPRQRVRRMELVFEWIERYCPAR